MGFDECRDGRGDFEERAASIVHPDSSVRMHQVAHWRGDTLPEPIEVPAIGGAGPHALAQVVVPVTKHLAAFALDGVAASHLVAQPAVLLLESLPADHEHHGRGN